MHPTVNGPPIPGPFVYAIKLIYLIDTWAIYKASFINPNIYCLWCSAVSLGMNPVPGGVINVFHGLANMLPS